MTLAQLHLALLRRAKRPGRLGALLSSAALKMVPRGSGAMEVKLWGRQLKLPADHHLPFIVGGNPLFSTSLVHCVEALGDGGSQRLTIIDVGANVGDSVALLESHLPGHCEFVCVEPNSDWVPYLKANTSSLPVEIICRFVGEGQLLAVKPTVPGTAGSQVSEAGERSIPLDEICAGRTPDLIKVDTDGFDFSILRSGKKTLASQRPALFFEWDPALWRQQGERPEEIFKWLGELGYRDLCFFADGGFLYCRSTCDQLDTIRSLMAVSESRRGIDNIYWDVFAATPPVCDRSIQRNLSAVTKLATEVRFWNRLQPTFWD